MTKAIQTPLSEEAVRELRAGEIIRLDGTLFTGRDAVHREEARGRKLPIDLSGAALFHAGPIIRTQGAQRELVAIGPTTSLRMEGLEAGFIRRTGIRLIIGKGGMGRETIAACKQYGCAYCLAFGGTAVSLAAAIEKVEGVYWEDLGMPEALWQLRARQLGPLVVAIDARGNDLFQVREQYQAAKEKALAASIEAFSAGQG